MVHPKNWRFFTLAAGVCWICSCTDRPILRDEIPGTYTASTRDVIDTLVISANGTYTHRGYVDGRLVASDSSRWAFPSDADSGGDKRVEFQGFLMLADRPRRPYTRGWWLALVERDGNGVVRLLIDSDTALYYNRI